ncbi:hypothetical protein SBRY_50509 [Actinacidiphila bryophytorum]|uniref:Uncharacterized protein n=1 Tax=Actinacidiphila bryophytorum TaxID=1436133 RepID=A0A9W4H527_9ACTN|nr:hypothetical protein SBRY_50509 [Actinacidiphila bryophytorum]
MVHDGGTRHPRHSGLGRPSTDYVHTTLEPDFGFLPIARNMTRCWLGSVDSAHTTGVAVFSQRIAPGPSAARSPTPLLVPGQSWTCPR